MGGGGCHMMENHPTSLKEVVEDGSRVFSCVCISTKNRIQFDWTTLSKGRDFIFFTRPYSLSESLSSS